MTKTNKWLPLEDESINPIDDLSLKALAQKCNKLEAIQTEIDQQDKHIKSLKEKQRKLSEEEIPTFLQEKGLTSIRLNNGTEVSVSEDIKPGVLVANRSFCYQWLRDNGFGDLIKNIVSVNFGMGEDKDALQLKKQIEKLGLVCAEKEDVHYQTLKAFVGEQHRKGANLPDEFGVHVANKTKIVQKKKIT